jgi:hypothetical protein
VRAHLRTYVQKVVQDAMEAGSGKDSGAGTQLFISNFVITALEEMRHMLAAASSKFPSERYFDERVVLSAEEDAIYRRSAVKRGTSRASDDGGGRGGPDDGARDEEHHERHADAHGHRNRDAPPPLPTVAPTRVPTVHSLC